MTLLLDLVFLSLRVLKRWTTSSICLVLLVALSCTGAALVRAATQAAPELGTEASAVPEDAGLILLGRSWPGSERDSVSASRVLSLAETLSYLECRVSPVFIYGEDEEQRISIGGNDYYIRAGLMGVGSEYPQIAGSALEVVRGRFFDAAEADSGARVAVIGSSIASLVDELVVEPMPTEIVVQGVAYTVVGVVADGPGYFAQHEQIRVSERLILPYRTLVDDVAASSSYAPDFRAVAYRRPSSITIEFIDKVVNDWLAQSDLSGRWFISHLRSLSSAGASGIAVIPSTRGSMSGSAVLVWVIVFTALPAALLGRIRMTERVGELELWRVTGASPLHLSLIAVMETSVLVRLGFASGVALTLLLLRPLIEGLTGLELTVYGSLCLSFVTASVSLLASMVGAIEAVLRSEHVRRM